MPLPDDPFTGKPFRYEVKDDTAHLRGSPPRGRRRTPRTTSTTRSPFGSEYGFGGTGLWPVRERHRPETCATMTTVEAFNMLRWERTTN